MNGLLMNVFVCPMLFLNEHLCTLSEFIVFIFVSVFFFFFFAIHHLLLAFLVAYKCLWYNQNKSPTRRPFMLDVTKEEFGSKTSNKHFF